jgi:uncharacterized protein (DUF362 family)
MKDVYCEQCSSYDAGAVGKAVSACEPLFLKTIRPGDHVILKPNWISHSHKERAGEWEQVITHPALIDAVLVQVLAALKGQGRVVITDGPQTSSSWEDLMRIMRPDRWVEMGKKGGIEVSVVDLRDDEWVVKGDMIVDRRKLEGDPSGSVVCNLEGHSEFVGKDAGRYGYFGADYDNRETNEAHSKGDHLYKVSKSVLDADVFINLPKLKTHKKAGMTCSLKNLVGINTYKNWLPHHTVGTPAEGGDQFPEKDFRSVAEGSFTRVAYECLAKNPHIAKFLIPVKKIGKLVFGQTTKTIRSGSWHGNDTLWRTVLDLNKVLFYADGNGVLRSELQERKRYLTIVDAVVSGEGNGPDAPDRKETGLVIAGTCPVSVDAFCAKIMGFDWTRIPALKNAFLMDRLPLCEFGYEDIQGRSSSLDSFNKPLSLIDPAFTFAPSIGWRGHVELKH